MALYEELVFADVIRPITQPLREGILEVDFARGKIIIKAALKPNAVYVNAKIDKERSCSLSEFYFNFYQIIPRKCRECWKVVLKLRDLTELFRMKNEQVGFVKEHGIPCKCGTENRLYTKMGGLCTAYFYTPLGEGKEGGLWLKELVADRFGDFGSPILKRGCTEFEHRHHPSSKWDELAEKLRWDFKEDLLNTTFELGKGFIDQPEQEHRFVEVNKMRTWIEKAFEHGDETYLEFCDGPMMPLLEHYELGEEKGGNGAGDSGKILTAIT